VKLKHPDPRLYANYVVEGNVHVENTAKTHEKCSQKGKIENITDFRCVPYVSGIALWHSFLLSDEITLSVVNKLEKVGRIKNLKEGRETGGRKYFKGPNANHG
jgi:hypothetical protein